MKINEEAFLKKLAGIIDDPDIEKRALDEIEKKSRERKLLEQFERALTTQHNKIEEIEEQLQEIVEEIIPESIVEDILPQVVLPVQDLTTQIVTKLRDTPPQDYEKVVSKLKDGFQKELDLMKKAIMDLHQFASGMSNMSGGGAGSIQDLDFRAILVTNPTYTAGRTDYYIGVNCSSSTTITLPATAKNGRQFVVKDESGACKTNNIIVIADTGGSIDNNSSAIMAIDNMSLTFIYRSGWRII
jgi:uncharacterized protein YutE (UPF0331/DUF86 family)